VLRTLDVRKCDTNSEETITLKLIFPDGITLVERHEHDARGNVAPCMIQYDDSNMYTMQHRHTRPLLNHDRKGVHQSEEICFSARCLASYLAFSRSNVSICATMSISDDGEEGMEGTHSASLELAVDEGAGEASE
jgi:hypothetical protein